MGASRVSSGRKVPTSQRGIRGTKHPGTKSGSRQYLRPPIVDAIIELRFATELSDIERQKVSKKFAGQYPIVEELVHQGIDLSVGENTVDAKAQILERITKRTSAEHPHILQIGTRILNVACGAPYEGWEALYGRFVSDWSMAKRVWGFRTIERIGLRYINRLDLTLDENGLVQYEDYLDLRINLPKDFADISLYQLNFQFYLKEIQARTNVVSASVPSALPGKGSFVLDVDVFRNDDVPQNEADVLTFLRSARACKNDLFETFITDKARELFDADNAASGS